MGLPELFDRHRGWVGLFAIIGASAVTALGVSVATPASRITAIEFAQAAQDARVDTLAAEFAFHVGDASLRDSTLAAKIDKLLAAECLDRSQRELDLMGIPCRQLLGSQR